MRTGLDVSRLIATYSIVARDAETGDLGVAVQSHYFSVGSVVPWAEPGVGAVATQAFGEPAYGALGLALLREGASPEDALAKLLAEDPGRETRQVAFIDAQGRGAGHTGASCIAAAGHHAGDGYRVQGNMLASDAVWKAMAEAYEGATGPLDARLFAALEAAEQAGGDLRGRQSAALTVVSGRRSDRPWEERRVDLRVEDHEDPLGELARLLDIDRARRHVQAASDAFAAGDARRAWKSLEAALVLQPEDPEVRFWAGVTLVGAGNRDQGLPMLRAACSAGACWRELLRRLPAVGLFPDDEALLSDLLTES